MLLTGCFVLGLLINSIYSIDYYIKNNLFLPFLGKRKDKIKPFEVWFLILFNASIFFSNNPKYMFSILAICSCIIMAIINLRHYLFNKEIESIHSLLKAVGLLFTVLIFLLLIR